MPESIEDDDLLAILDEDYADAQSYTDDVIGIDRAKALDYYMRRPMGDERPGHSSVIAAEVFKVVEGVSTAIAEIYASTDTAVEFAPRRASGVEQAQQRTQAVRYVIYTQNLGILSMIEAIKDGILLKTGYLTWRWETSKRMTQERYQGLSDVALELLTSDNQNVKVVEAVPRQEVEMTEKGPVVTTVYDVVVNVVNETGRVVFESVPPEEIMVGSRARSQDVTKAPVLIWRTDKTMEDLRKCGYDDELLEQLQAGSTFNDSPVVRRSEDSGNREFDVVELRTHWREIDLDGDGVVELRRIVRAGSVILENEIVDEINLSAWGPNIQPHEFFARCPADEACENQEVNTVLLRQTLDNLYLANNPMWRVDTTDTSVNINDFYDPEIGRPLRGKAGSAEPVIFPFVAQHTFPMMEFVQADQENKTGFSRYAQGLDADSLNQTARGISIITSMSQQRVKLMARLFGELCLAPAMRGISKLLSQHAQEPLMMRLNGGQYAEIDPREWAEEFDMTVNVGLGVTDKDQQLVHLQAIAGAQAQAAAGGGMGKLVTMKNLYNVQAKIAENAGFKDPSFAWTDPDTVPAQPPQPDPMQQKLEQDKKQAEADAALEKYKADLDAQNERYKAQLKADTDIAIAQIKAAAQPQGASLPATSEEFM